MKTKILLLKVKELLNNALAKELNDQGHYLTGALERSMGASAVIDKSNETELIGFALDYAQDLEDGKKGSDIGNMKTHIAELFKYFLLRGLSQNEAVDAAVRTAKRHKKEGMPTEASKRFSKTGERKHFITRTWSENQQKVDSLMDFGMDSMFNEEFTKQKNETI